jgi:type IV fimbrial biogenesis protein FimU
MPLKKNLIINNERRSLIIFGERNMLCRRGSPGFTLVELMIVVVILGIFASIAVPSFTDLIRRNRVQSASEELYGLLQYARTEAVARGRPITIEKNQDGSWLIKASDKVLREQTFTAVNLQSSHDSLVFRPNGTASGWVDITICAPPSYSRKLNVENSGRVVLSPQLTVKEGCAS